MFKTGLVVGKFAPLHKGHELVLQTAQNECQRVLVLCYSHPDFPTMPSPTRAGWIRALYPNLEVYEPQNPPPNDSSDFIHREFVRHWLESHGEKVDAVFGSDDYLAGFAAHIGAVPLVVDAARIKVPISGTRLRQDPSNLLQFVSPLIRRHLEFWEQPVQKVVFLGAESTGKSTLTARMAQEYNTVFVAEYGREVWERKNGQLELGDYIHIAQTHRQLEEVALKKAKDFLFVDTNAITTMFLGYAYAGNALPELIELAREAQSRYHHVFLCADDIPFEQDGWRDDEVWRSRAQGIVRYDLRVRGITYTELHGTLEERVEQVKAVLESYTNSPRSA